MLRLHIGLDSWIIQDGNHRDFESGLEYRFALQFHPHALAPSSSATGQIPGFRREEGAVHDVTARVIRRAPDYWVIDFGVPAFQDAAPPPWVAEGTWIRGSVYVGVDPFFYVERLKREVGTPDLLRTWRIRRILLETTPWQETTDAGGGRIVSRVHAPPTFREVGRTDAWEDDEQRAHYVLDCELVTA